MIFRCMWVCTDIKVTDLTIYSEVCGDVVSLRSSRSHRMYSTSARISWKTSQAVKPGKEAAFGGVPETIGIIVSGKPDTINAMTYETTTQSGSVRRRKRECGCRVYHRKRVKQTYCVHA